MSSGLDYMQLRARLRGGVIARSSKGKQEAPLRCQRPLIENVTKRRFVSPRKGWLAISVE